MSDKKIFISHSKADELIGEKLLDSFVEMGIPSDIVFYSSKYHNGARLGKDFHSVVKQALEDCEIVIFLLTPNFYKSEYCLNEMGAVWYANKHFIPILLGNLKHSDMKGFIDSHYIALTPSEDQTYKLYSELKKYIKMTDGVAIKKEDAFIDFVRTANQLANEIPVIVENLEISETEIRILNKKFTDNEIIFLQYFIENETTSLKDVKNYDYGDKQYYESEELIAIKDYADKFKSFNYNKAQGLLEKSGYLTNNYNYDDEYEGCEINIDFFRDLISLSHRGKEYIKSILTKYRKYCKSTNGSNELDKYFADGRLTEIETLLFAYMQNTNDVNLGDRWMADKSISKILNWENSTNLNHKLSQNYSVALNSFINKDFVEAVSYTSYGNPRQYRLKKEFIDGLGDMGYKTRKILEDAIKSNVLQVDDDELPF